MTDGRREDSGYNGSTANTGIAPENAVLLEEASTHVNIDPHFAADQEIVPAAIDKAQLLPPSIPLLPHQSYQEVESSIADKMVLTLPYHCLPDSRPPRSKVLLVEDNAINMKVPSHSHSPIQSKCYLN